MLGFNGGLLGKSRVPTLDAASGLWFPNEQSVARRGAIWPATGDPFFSSVSLLLHMNGSNGSTVFTDNSSNAVAVTANGNAQISTAQSKFGGASGYFDGAGDYIKTSASANLAMGTGDFTMEAWVYIAGGSGYRQIFSTRPSNGSSANNGSLAVNPSNGLSWFTNALIVDYSSSIGTSQWVHVAVSRSGSSLKVFANGQQVGSTASNTQDLTANVLSAGANGDGSEPFNGYIDDLRITKGVARYTANFTAPTAPFPDA
jgi:hypothetical protein